MLILVFVFSICLVMNSFVAAVLGYNMGRLREQSEVMRDKALAGAVEWFARAEKAYGDDVEKAREIADEWNELANRCTEFRNGLIPRAADHMDEVLRRLNK